MKPLIRTIVFVIIVLGLGAAYLLFFAPEGQRDSTIAMLGNATERMKRGAEKIGSKIQDSADGAKDSMQSVSQPKKDKRAEVSGEGLFAEAPEDLAPILDRVMAAAKAGDKKMVETTVKGMILPESDAWFTEVFGAETGKRLAEDYQKDIQQFLPLLRQYLAEAARGGRSKASVTRHEPEGDDGASDRQKKLFAAMKEPVVLYTLRLARPGAAGGPTLGSFVYAEGGYRFIGELPALP